jgi:hypothetical protein
VGKKVSLSAGILPGGLGLAVTNPKWTIGGDAIKNYVCTTALGQITPILFYFQVDLLPGLCNFVIGYQ